MRIFAINRYYRPDISATSQLLTDLAEGLAAEGNDVEVLASNALYSGGRSLPKRERLSGVNVTRLSSTRMGRRSLALRLIDHATFYCAVALHLIFNARRGDIIIAKTDPPMLSVIAAIVARLRGARVVNWCQDLFPEVAGVLGVGWSRGAVGRVLRSARNWSLSAADINVVLHETMNEHLAAEGIAPSKLRVIQNWAIDGLSPARDAAEELRRDWGLSDRFVIGYSGNLGRAHMPETVAAFVEETADIPGLSWLFIGDGKGFAQIEAIARRRSNVVVKPHQPRERLSQTLSLPDLHLISLEPACEGLIVPSKLSGVLAVGRPVLFLGHHQGAVAREILPRGIGWVVDPEAPETWRPAIDRAREEILADGASFATEAVRGGQARRGLSEWSAAIRSLQTRPAPALHTAGTEALGD